MKSAKTKPSMCDEYLKDPKQFFLLKGIGSKFPGITYETARNWVYRGVRRSRRVASSLVKLRTFRAGATLMTSHAAVEEFLRATGGDS